MAAEKLLSISQFAHLSGIRRKNLIFYDEIGLFSPAHVGENGYRYYSYRQFDTANLIWSLKEIGMSLKDIKEYTRVRTPQRMLELFYTQKTKVEDELHKLKEIHSMMEMYIRSTEECLAVDTSRITLEQHPRDHIALGPPIDYTDGKTVMDATGDFYDFMQKSGYVCSYPLGSLITQHDVLHSQVRRPHRFYFRMPAGPDETPGGLHLTGYDHGDYGETDALYARMQAYLAEHHLVMAGDAYEEYLINEISAQRPEDYLFRIIMPVRRQDDGELRKRPGHRQQGSRRADGELQP